ncbi:hypothetical protein C5167_031786 [Papaver somniferum]|uniref:Protein kinase domain-containing protein n=1 Tax=Papaver somniferum TaxID=3469 RepID=A0A4Y7K9A8_PAPSO|nr:receptor-like protein kinase HSL1 [Papaver somniferum]RZC68519.1 hypothetical protein C5167_031786 [Papaver somniferum]
MAKMRKTHSQKPIFSILSILSLLFLSATSQKIQENVEEQRILLKLKQEFGNPSALQSWSPSSNPSHCTDWSGITCNSNNSVTEISLHNMNITEKVPDFVCDLRNLTWIDLSWNYFPGEFPVSVLNCTNLEYLDLTMNNFVGVIPNEIDRVKKLKVLDLSANNFTGDIPPEIGNLEFLEILSLTQNHFNGTFPVEIGKLVNLEVLEMPLNEFVPSKIPDEFSNLVKLKRLFMKDSNLFGEIPEWFGDLKDLEVLNLQTNNLNGKIPESLFLLKNLSYVNLAENKLSGGIPEEIECLGMEGFDLSNNELNGSIPEGFGKWKNLTNLVIYWNRLTGEIPVSIGLLPLLTDIRLFGNDLTGELPGDLGLHSKLQYLEVDTNRLTGKLPENLCFGGEFSGISAFSNNFTGEIPKSLGKCPSLKNVLLYKNMLGGELPASFWSPVSLLVVQIHDNMFSGALPDMLSSRLERLEIENNRFTGRIPLGIGSSAQLVVFDGSNNLFTGEIPIGLTALSNLTSLALDGNEISGSIPSDIISWKSLDTLTLSRNRISGALPPKIGSLPNLNKLDLSENQISGPIPFEIANSKLSSLNLSSNLLSGKVPSQLEAFEDSFFNNSGLCSNAEISNLVSCNSLSSRSSRRLSPKFIALIVVVVVVTILLAVILVLVAIKSIYKRKQDDEEDSVTWKVIKFQRLVDFSESQILSGLTKSSLIGSGGCGEVYKVSINHLDKAVAVKKISSKGKVDSKHATQFQAEVEILGNIKHNNIVKLMGYMSSKYTKLLVYEYMENGSLDQWLHQRNNGNLDERRTLDWQKRLKIAVGVAQGLSYIHHNCSPPIIHRDVKSSNILLDSDFKAKVADFGVAKIVQAGQPYSASIVAGSFGYIAPEYGRTLKVNEKVDVYSFGVVLLELVTGREANKGDEDRSLAEWAAHRFLETPLDALLDEEVKEGSNVAEMTSVFRLGLMCTSALPSNRPTMSGALQYLVRHCSSQEVYEKKALVTADNDVAPLLLSRHSADLLSTYKGGRSKKRVSDVDHSALEV